MIIVINNNRKKTKGKETIRYAERVSERIVVCGTKEKGGKIQLYSIRYTLDAIQLYMIGLLLYKIRLLSIQSWASSTHIGQIRGAKERSLY